MQCIRLAGSIRGFVGASSPPSPLPPPLPVIREFAGVAESQQKRGFDDVASGSEIEIERKGKRESVRWW